MAVGFDLSGSYAPVLAISATAPALLAVASPFLPLKKDGRVL